MVRVSPDPVYAPICAAVQARIAAYNHAKEAIDHAADHGTVNVYAPHTSCWGLQKCLVETNVVTFCDLKDLTRQDRYNLIKYADSKRSQTDDKKTKMAICEAVKLLVACTSPNEIKEYSCEHDESGHLVVPGPSLFDTLPA